MTWHAMLCAAVVLTMFIGTWRARVALRALRAIADRRDGGRP